MFGNINRSYPQSVIAIFAVGLISLTLFEVNSEQAPITPVDAMQTLGTDRPATNVKPLSCEKLADIPGKTVTTAMVVFPPDGYTPAHRHPGSVTAYVLKGAVRSRLEGGPAITYRKGESWFEPAGILHLYAENASATETAEILTFFVTDENCGPLVIPEPQRQ